MLYAGVDQRAVHRNIKQKIVEYCYKKIKKSLQGTEKRVSKKRGPPDGPREQTAARHEWRKADAVGPLAAAKQSKCSSQGPHAGAARDDYERSRAERQAVTQERPELFNPLRRRGYCPRRKLSAAVKPGHANLARTT